MTVVCACQSPTLPLPPPGAPDVYEIAPDRESMYVHGATAEEGALVLVYNEQTASGAIVTSSPDGIYETWVPANLRDFASNHLRIWQRIGLDDSDSVEIDLPQVCALTPTPDGGWTLPPLGTKLHTSCAPFDEPDAAESQNLVEAGYSDAGHTADTDVGGDAADGGGAP